MMRRNKISKSRRAAPLRFLTQRHEGAKKGLNLRAFAPSRETNLIPATAALTN